MASSLHLLVILTLKQGKKVPEACKKAVMTSGPKVDWMSERLTELLSWV